MTSPIGTSPAPPEGSAPPAGGTPIEIFGMRLPVPKWAFYSITLFVTIGAAVPVFSQLVIPLTQEFTATSKAEKAKAEAARAKADEEKAKAEKEAASLRAKKEEIEQQLVRYKEYQIHYGEAPKSTRELFNSADLGSLSVSFFTSDGCLRVNRKAPGHNQAELIYWIAAKSIPLEAPPGKLDDVKVSRQEVPPTSQPFLNASYQFASLDPAAAAPTAGKSVAGCLDPHPGAFQSWNGQQNGCWIQVWRRWPEGCQHYQWFNGCNGYWDNHPNGAPRVYWTSCAH
ncbi:MAG: hypothetical protein QOD28_1460 [Acidobacteriota bacterium]|nr:hypothetical protein [Acidobacteriota bacterium]